jgi:hypothetical protein
MAKGGKRADQQTREREAADRAAHGQSRALGDTGDRQTGVEPGHQGISNRPADRGDEAEGGAARQSSGTAADLAEVPMPEAGAPPLQEQERSSLDDPSQSGRPRDEGDDSIERTGAQGSPRRDPEAVRPAGSPGPDDNTM